MVNAMKHDLKAINAAIQLGDRIVPPVGCEIRYYDAVYDFEYSGRIVRHDLLDINFYRYDVYISKFESDAVEIIEIMYIGACEDDVLLEILFIPEYIRPFSEWTRY
jgi:hypothetical protein